MAGAPFLNVSQSLTGRRWVDRLDAAAQREALAISQLHGLRDTLKGGVVWGQVNMSIDL